MTRHQAKATAPLKSLCRINCTLRESIYALERLPPFSSSLYNNRKPRFDLAGTGIGHHHWHGLSITHSTHLYAYVPSYLEPEFVE